MQRYTEHYTAAGIDRNKLIAINDSISQVIGEPWATMRDAVVGAISFLPIPNPEGFKNAETGAYFTQAQMLAGTNLLGVVVTEFNLSWLPRQPLAQQAQGVNP